MSDVHMIYQAACARCATSQPLTAAPVAAVAARSQPPRGPRNIGRTGRSRRFARVLFEIEERLEQLGLFRNSTPMDENQRRFETSRVIGTPGRPWQESAACGARLAEMQRRAFHFVAH